jgi:hypothetical protein
MPLRPGIIGMRGVICEDCLNPYFAPLLLHPDPSYEKSFHQNCTGIAKFESDQAKVEQLEKSERDVIYRLVKTTKECRADGKIVLGSINIKSYSLDLKGQFAAMHSIKKEPQHYISRAINLKITLVKDDAELQDFFAHNRATYGFYEIIETGDQHAIFLCNPSIE